MARHQIYRCYNRLVSSFAAVFMCSCVSSSVLGPATSLPTLPEVIRGSEIERANSSSAYEAIQKLRPNFIRSMRAASSDSQRPVYLDGVKIEMELLRMIPASSIVEVRLLNSADATTRFGTGHTEGALVIVTKH